MVVHVFFIFYQFEVSQLCDVYFISYAYCDLIFRIHLVQCLDATYRVSKNDDVFSASAVYMNNRFQDSIHFICKQMFLISMGYYVRSYAEFPQVHFRFLPVFLSHPYIFSGNFIFLLVTQTITTYMLQNQFQLWCILTMMYPWLVTPW